MRNTTKRVEEITNSIFAGESTPDKISLAITHLVAAMDDESWERHNQIIAELKDIKSQKTQSDEIRDEVKLLKKDMATIKPAIIILTTLVSLIAAWAVPKILGQLFDEVPLPKAVEITREIS